MNPFYQSWLVVYRQLHITAARKEIKLYSREEEPYADLQMLGIKPLHFEREGADRKIGW